MGRAGRADMVGGGFVGREMAEDLRLLMICSGACRFLPIP